MNNTNSGIYKLVIIGDRNVGKTTYIKRLLTGEFEKEYKLTILSDIHRYICNSTQGEIDFHIQDFAGNTISEKYLNYSNYIKFLCKSNAIILMFDLTSRESFMKLREYTWLLEKFECFNKPIIVCGNKCDLNYYEVDSMEIKNFMDSLNSITDTYKYFDLSANTNYNLKEPFLQIARYITKRENILFIENNLTKPQKIKINKLSVEISNLPEVKVNEFSEIETNKPIKIVINESPEVKISKPVEVRINKLRKVKNAMYMKIPIKLYNSIVSILNRQSSQFYEEFKNCIY